MKRFPDSRAVIVAMIAELDAPHVIPSHVQALRPFSTFIDLVHQAPASADPAAILDSAELAIAPLAVAIDAAGEILQQARIALGLLPDDDDTELDDAEGGPAPGTGGDGGGEAGDGESLESEDLDADSIPAR